MNLKIEMNADLECAGKPPYPALEVLEHGQKLLESDRVTRTGGC